MSFSVKGTLVGTEPRSKFKADIPYWMDDAECLKANPLLFFSPPGRNTAEREQERIAEAKSFCASCHVRQECLELALKEDDTWAIMGGMTADERRRMKRRNSATARSEATG